MANYLPVAAQVTNVNVTIDSDRTEVLTDPGGILIGAGEAVFVNDNNTVILAGGDNVVTTDPPGADFTLDRSDDAVATIGVSGEQFTIDGSGNNVSLSE